MATKNLKYAILYIDMMGFVNRAIIDKKNTGFSEDDLRLFYQCKIVKKIERLEKKGVIINSEKMYTDSWLLISPHIDSWEILKIIREILETTFEFEIFVDILELSKSEYEKMNLSPDMMIYLKTRFPSAVTFLKEYKEWYKKMNTNPLEETFILLTANTYDEFYYKSICAKPYLSAKYYLVDYNEFKNFTALAQKPFLTQRTFILNNDYISIPTETDRRYNIVVPPGIAFLYGDFRAFGGKENSILVRILDEKTEKTIYYNSALVTNGHIGQILAAGKYIIIFSNKYDIGMGAYKDTSYDKIVATTIYLENVIPMVPQVSEVLPLTPSWIAFERWLKNPDGKSWNVELWIVRSDGYELRQLTKGFYDTGPEWSLDGLRISFSRIGKDIEGIFIVDSDGKDIQRLSSNIRAYYAQWIGEDLVLFSTSRGSESEFKDSWRLYTVSLKDKSEKMIDVGLPGVSSAKVSQNHQFIAFNKDESVYISDIDGRNVKKLKSPLGGVIKGYPVRWYPDNERVIIQSKGDCFRVGLDGIVEPIAGISECNLSWSPDGRTIVYQFNNEIWLMDSNFQNKRMLIKSNDESIYRNPVWQHLK